MSERCAGPGSPRSARLILSAIGEPGDPRLSGLVAELGPVEVLAALRDQAASSVAPGGETESPLLARLADADPTRDLEAAARVGARFVTPEDPEWPAGLRDLAHVDPLHRRGGVPIALWVRGPAPLAEALAGAVAVVGSRSATSYGAELAGEIGHALAGAGRAVVSGAAFGIDQAAHRGALAGRGPTIAILACGVDQAYPSAHRRLLDVIAETGAIVSEAPPGSGPTRVRFLARNRLIAAATAGTVVVEAAARSGALNTANWAASLSRVVMGVPGPVSSAQSEGVHRLMRERGALVVTSGAEVAEAVSASGTALTAARAPVARPWDRLGQDQRQVLDALPRTGAATVEAIAKAALLTRRRAAAALAELEGAGFCRGQGEMWQLSQDPVDAPAP